MHGLRGHPAVGSSFESFAVESLCTAAAPGYQPYHYRTATGDEIDLVLAHAGEPEIAIEIKLSTAPTLSAGFHRACANLGARRRYLVHPETGDEPYRQGDVTVIGLSNLVRELREHTK